MSRGNARPWLYGIALWQISEDAAAAITTAAILASGRAAALGQCAAILETLFD